MNKDEDLLSENARLREQIKRMEEEKKKVDERLTIAEEEKKKVEEEKKKIEEEKKKVEEALRDRDVVILGLEEERAENARIKTGKILNESKMEQIWTRPKIPKGRRPGCWNSLSESGRERRNSTKRCEDEIPSS